MTRKATSVLFSLVLILILSLSITCAPAPTPPTPYSTVSIPIEEFPNHPHIDVVMHAIAGEELTVTLGSNPTTGFRWSEFAEISDESVIKQVSHKFVGPGIDKPPGTSGEEVWTFKAL